MKDIIIYTIWLTGSFSLLLVSAAMAVKGIDGWGWFLATGIACISAFSYNSNNSKNKKEG